MIYLGISGIEFPHLDKYFHNIENKIFEYSLKYKVIELYSSLYSTPTDDRIIYLDNTDDNFTIVGRMLKDITYQEGIIQDDIINNHLWAIKKLKQKFSLLLIHFNHNFSRSNKHIDYIEDLLNSIEKYFDGHILLDFANKTWFSFDENLKNLINRYSSSIVNSDKYLTPHNMRNPDIFYLRLMGDKSLVPTNSFGIKKINKNRDLNYWSNYINSLSKRHKLIYVIIGNHFSGDAYQDLIYLNNQLKKFNIK